MFRRVQTLISTYVKDFVILSLFNEQMNNTVAAQAHTISLKNLADMTKFLDINIDLGFDGILINGEDKIEDICERLEMNHCSGVATSISDYSLLEYDTEKLYSISEEVQYRCIVSSLLYITYITRPGIN